MSKHRIREIGIPVRSVNRASLYPSRGADGRPRIIGTMSQQAAGFFILVIDPEDGSFRQIGAPDDLSNYTTAVCTSRTGRVYIGAAHTGQLYCYDPDAEDLLDLGTINPEAAIFPCRIDEEPIADIADGTAREATASKIWISSYGTADLTSFDPETGAFERYGRMDEVDMYAYCFVNADGRIASLIRQTKPHVVVLDPASREKRIVGPVTIRGEGVLDLVRGIDGLLYIQSSEGDFRIDGFDAVPVDRVPPAETVRSEFPDGTGFRYSDGNVYINRNLEVTRPDGSIESFYLDYEAAGTELFCLHAGPDGCVYGSSVLPEHFFRFDPGTGEMVDFGICSQSAGEAYSMANFRGRIYISSYPGARVSIYDPKKPYDFNDTDASNPRDIGRLDDISYRPRSTLAGPGGKVWFASVPDYGMWGGPLSWYDPATDRKKSYLRICGDASCYALAWLEDLELILVGTTVAGGSGTQPRVDRASLFLFDYADELKVWEEAPADMTASAGESQPNENRAVAVTSLLPIDGTRAIGIVQYDHGDYLIRVDGEMLSVEGYVRLESGRAVDNGIFAGPEGVYVLTRTGILEIDTERLELEPVLTFENEITGMLAAGPVIGKDFYFAKGHRLMAAELHA